MLETATYAEYHPPPRAHPVSSLLTLQLRDSPRLPLQGMDAVPFISFANATSLHRAFGLSDTAVVKQVKFSLGMACGLVEGAPGGTQLCSSCIIIKKAPPLAVGDEHLPSHTHGLHAPRDTKKLTVSIILHFHPMLVVLKNNPMPVFPTDL